MRSSGSRSSTIIREKKYKNILQLFTRQRDSPACWHWLNTSLLILLHFLIYVLSPLAESISTWWWSTWASTRVEHTQQQRTFVNCQREPEKREKILRRVWEIFRNDLEVQLGAVDLVFFLADFCSNSRLFFLLPCWSFKCDLKRSLRDNYFFGVGVKIEFEEFKRARFGASTSKYLFDIDESSLVTGVVCCIMSFVRIERPNRSCAAANVRKI